MLIADEYYQSEKRLIENMHKIKEDMKLSDGTSGLLLQCAKDEIIDSNFSDAENILKEVEGAIDQENSILKKIMYIRGLIPGMSKQKIKEMTALVDKSLNSLKEGDFENARKLINGAEQASIIELENVKYEDEKSILIKDIEETLMPEK